MKKAKRLIYVLILASVFLGPVNAQTNDSFISDSSIVNAVPEKIFIDPLSIRPLYLILVKNDKVLGTATGFVVQKGSNHYLITNWHVVAGRNLETNQIISASGDIPDALLIWHHGKQLGSWVRKKEQLYDEKGTERWIEHNKKRTVDVVALPLWKIDYDDVTLYPFDLSLADSDMVPEVAMPVSIIGFPLGLTSAGFFPIWKTGHIASEPNIDYHGEPLFLIDATTRGGMSGSPVVLRLNAGYKTQKGTTIMSSSGYRTRFLGVYSGRLPRDSEIGRVWRPHLISEILP
jgi:hypothetical protein